MIPLITGSTKALTANFRHWAHLGTLVIVGALLIGYVVWTARSAKRRRGSCWHKWGPTILIALATCFIQADPARHVLQDQNVWLEIPLDKSAAQCRGFMGCGGSGQYQCASSSNPTCCRGAVVDGLTYENIYEGCVASGTSGSPACTYKRHHASGDESVRIPADLLCDAGKGAYVLDKFLSQPWEGGGGITNRQELAKLGVSNATIHTYFYENMGSGCHSKEAYHCLGFMGVLFTM